MKPHMTLLHQRLPFGVTFTDQTTRVLFADSKPDAEEQAWMMAARLTMAYYQRREIGVQSVVEIHPKEVSYWPDAPPAQVGLSDEDYDHEKNGGEAA